MPWDPAKYDNQSVNDQEAEENDNNKATAIDPYIDLSMTRPILAT
jgi:hypothetical protein